jgi:ABC-type Fe3+-hydroxamate transport system substrate-binding protein
MMGAVSSNHLPLFYMKRLFTDQLGAVLSIEFPPKNIVSLVPSQTELLFDLGLGAQITGVTKFCIHPEKQVRSKVRIGGTKKLNLEMIRALKPDLIIGNKEENERSDIETLRKEFPVWMSDILTLEDAMTMINDIGELVDRAPEAAYLNHLIRAGFNDLQTLALEKDINKTVLYLIWAKPYMAAGKNTYINDILARIGLTNVVVETRYPELGLEVLQGLNPDLIFLSSEPYPFKDQHVEKIQQLVPAAEVIVVDGEMFSWYGSRLVKAVEYLFHLQRRVT